MRRMPQGPYKDQATGHEGSDRWRVPWHPRVEAACIPGIPEVAESCSSPDVDKKTWGVALLEISCNDLSKKDFRLDELTLVLYQINIDFMCKAREELPFQYPIEAA